jgi:hypothetical protein
MVPEVLNMVQIWTLDAKFGAKMEVLCNTVVSSEWKQLSVRYSYIHENF